MHSYFVWGGANRWRWSKRFHHHNSKPEEWRRGHSWQQQQLVPVPVTSHWASVSDFSDQGFNLAPITFVAANSPSNAHSSSPSPIYVPSPSQSPLPVKQPLKRGRSTRPTSEGGDTMSQLGDYLAKKGKVSPIASSIGQLVTAAANTLPADAQKPQRDLSVNVMQFVKDIRSSVVSGKHNSWSSNNITFSPVMMYILTSWCNMK